MSKKQDLEGKKETIEQLGLDAIEKYFEVDLSGMDPSVLQHLHNRARIGMQFEREMSTSKRAVEMNYIRIFRLVAEDKAELKKMIKKGLPKYLP